MLVGQVGLEPTTPGLSVNPCTSVHNKSGAANQLSYCPAKVECFGSADHQRPLSITDIPWNTVVDNIQQKNHWW